MSNKNGKWLHAFDDYLDKFGLVKFAEINSLNINDFERSFKHYVSIIKSKLGSQFSEHKFAENDSEYLDDFTKSFKQYFAST